MKRLIKYVALLSILFYFGANNFLFAQENQKKEEKKFTSLWEGKLKFGAVALRIVIKTFKNDDGSNGAFMDSPDQSVNNIPVENVLFTEDSLKFESKTLGAKYIGAAVKDSMIIRGNFTQRGMTLPLELKKIDKLVEIKRPQNPQKPYPYNDEEVTFENKSANITLAGSFTYPKGNGKYPAVVLVTGSGPQDRDESLMNHKPFLVISDYLTRNGIAVLRFDDRGIAKSKGNFATATTEDFATDAIAAVEYLKTRKEVDPKKIGVAGHSEGGLIAPMCAVNSGDVHFIVMIAGTGVTGKEILLLQAKLISQASGVSEEKINKDNKLSEKVYDIVLSEPDNDKAEKQLNALYDEMYPTLSDEEKKEADSQKPMMVQQIKQILSPWFRFFLKYDPRPALENVTVPVLAINGGKDVQVDPKQNLPEIEKALKAGGNKNFKIVELPGLNHLFQKCKTCTITEYGELEETFSVDALKTISDWILEVTK